MRSGAAPPLEETAIAALQDALAAEHAALWCYGLAVAFLGPEQSEQARADSAAHLKLRGDLEATISQVGSRPASAQPAYATPQPVTDAASAAVLAVVAETDALAAWRSVLERTTVRELRQAALRTLAETTLRCARWRTATDALPAVPPFPGR